MYSIRTGNLRKYSWTDKAKFVLKATRQHARNLAFFVTCYKTLMILQRRLNGGKERKADPFFAGLVGGYLVFGENNNINQQVMSTIYLSMNCADIVLRSYCTFRQEYCSAWAS